MADEIDYRYTGSDPVNIDQLPTKVADEGVNRKEIAAVLQTNVHTLAELQARLYSRKQRGVIVIFQGMDAAGKDGMIRHVMSGLNPEGTSVVNFKQPTQVQLAHDFLWRISQSLPERGEIRVFNRSQYEDVLISKVHPEILVSQNLPGIQAVSDVNEAFFETRYRDLKNYEKYLRHQGFVMLKFFLHLSKAEQANRFARRIEQPEKNWKFSASDIKERGYWDEYQKAYSAMLSHTATKKAPWYLIPADDKWRARLIVSNILVQRFRAMGLNYPEVTPEARAQLQKILGDLKEEKH